MFRNKPRRAAFHIVLKVCMGLQADPSARHSASQRREKPFSLIYRRMPEIFVVCVLRWVSQSTWPSICTMVAFLAAVQMPLSTTSRGADQPGGSFQHIPTS